MNYFVDGILNYLVNELWNLNADIIDAAEEGYIVRRDIIFTKIETLENLCFNGMWGGTGVKFTICEHSIPVEKFTNLCIDGVIAIPQFYLAYKNDEENFYKEYDCGRYKEKGE